LPKNPTDLIQILGENKTLRDGHVDTRLGILLSRDKVCQKAGYRTGEEAAAREE